MNWLYQLSDRPGPHIVFIHGWGSDSHIWRGLRAALPGSHYCVDLPGCGFNQDSVLPGLDEFIQDLAEQLPEGAVLVGWSLGGMIATRLAAIHKSKIRALVTLACNASFIQRPDWPLAMEPEVFQNFSDNFQARPEKTWTRFCALQTQGDKDAKAQLALLKSQTGPKPEQSIHWQQLLNWLVKLDNRSCLAEINCPQLHLYGEHDALVPQAVADEIRGLICAADSDAQLRVIKQVAHALPLACPNAVAGMIVDLCQRSEPQQTAINKSDIQSSFTRSARVYEQAAAVQRQIASELLDHIPESNWAQDSLDLGCGTGFVGQELQARGVQPKSLVQADLSESMLQLARTYIPADQTARLALCDAEQLPFAEASFNLVSSSLMLQWCQRLDAVFSGVYTSLQGGGSFAFATLVSDTLVELKQAWKQIDDYTHVNDFCSVASVREALLRSGFEISVMDRSKVQAHYPDVLSLCRDLKTIGAHNMNSGRNRGLTSPRQLQCLQAAYEPLRTEQGLPLSYDVLIVIARKPQDA